MSRIQVLAQRSFDGAGIVTAEVTRYSRLCMQHHVLVQLWADLMATMEMQGYLMWNAW